MRTGIPSVESAHSGVSVFSFCRSNSTWVEYSHGRKESGARVWGLERYVVVGASDLGGWSQRHVELLRQITTLE